MEGSWNEDAQCVLQYYNTSISKFLWASDEINKRPNEYWLRVLDLARKNTVNRIKRCGTIMGRSDEGDDSIPVA